MNKLTAVLLAILIITVALLAYFFSKNKDLLYPTSKQPTFNREISVPSASPLEATSSPVASPPNLNQSQVQTVIRNLVNAKNYKGLIPYIKTPTVQLTLTSSDCCGELSVEDAVTQMGYLNNGVPFEFNQEADLARKVKERNPIFNSYFIGVSTINEQAVAFKLNSNAQIEEIQMAASYKLYGF